MRPVRYTIHFTVRPKPASESRVGRNQQDTANMLARIHSRKCREDIEPPSTRVRCMELPSFRSECNSGRVSTVLVALRWMLKQMPLFWSSAWKCLLTSLPRCIVVSKSLRDFGPADEQLIFFPTLPAPQGLPFPSTLFLPLVGRVGSASCCDDQALDGAGEVKCCFATGWMRGDRDRPRVSWRSAICFSMRVFQMNQSLPCYAR